MCSSLARMSVLAARLCYPDVRSEGDPMTLDLTGVSDAKRMREIDRWIKGDWEMHYHRNYVFREALRPINISRQARHRSGERTYAQMSTMGAARSGA